MKNCKFYPSIVLSAICLVVAVLLSVINYFTAPIIDQREKDKSAGALAVVLPGGSDFQPMSLDGLPEGVLEAHSAVGGYVFKVKGTGRNGDIVVMVGVDADGKIAGTQLISNSESAGYKEPVFAQVDGPDTAYKGQDLANYEAIIVTGSTMTSNGYAEAINVALRAFAAVSGGDSRTPEQIFQDNCNAALGTEGLTFTKWFATEVVTGVDTVYVASDKSGFVFEIGENLIGVNSTGVTTAGASADDAAAATAAYALTSVALTEIDLPDGVSAEVKKAYVTATGNYVFELVAEGYKSESVHHFGGNLEASYINIKVSIAADGKIIDVVTVSQKETSGIGDKCQTEDYYDQYRGAGSSDIVISADRFEFDLEDYEMDLIPGDSTDVGVIGGATFTTVAYQEAIKAAFSAFE